MSRVIAPCLLLLLVPLGSGCTTPPVAAQADDAAPAAVRLGAFEAAFLEFGDGFVHVIDRDGNPVEGATVWLLEDWVGWSRGTELLGEFTTPADGTIDLGDLDEPVGRSYWLLAHRPGYALGVASLGWPDAGATVALFPPSADRITVTLPDGSPAASLRLWLSEPLSPLWRPWPGLRLPEPLQERFAVTTDGTGSVVLGYEVAGWMGGTWRATGPDGEPLVLRDGWGQGPGRLTPAPPAFTPPPAQPPRSCTIAGRVVNQEGDPVANAYVEATHEDRKVRLFWPQTDEDGRYELTSPAGEVELFVLRAPEPYRSSMQPENLIDATAPRPRYSTGVEVVTAREGGVVAVPDIVAPRAVRLSGVVRGPDGRPVPGAEVLASRADVVTGTLIQGPLALFPVAVTDAAGRYEFFADLPGRNTLIAARTEEAVSPEPVTVTLDTGAAVDLTVDPDAAAWIVGRITDEDAQPFDRAVVTLIAPRSPASSLGPVFLDVGPVSADGRYRFGPLVPGCPYAARVVVRAALAATPAEGGAPVAWTLIEPRAISPGETWTQDFTVRPTGEE